RARPTVAALCGGAQRLIVRGGGGLGRRQVDGANQPAGRAALGLDEQLELPVAAGVTPAAEGRAGLAPSAADGEGVLERERLAWNEGRVGDQRLGVAEEPARGDAGALDAGEGQAEVLDGDGAVEGVAEADDDRA